MVNYNYEWHKDATYDTFLYFRSLIFIAHLLIPLLNAETMKTLFFFKFPHLNHIVPTKVILNISSVCLWSWFSESCMLSAVSVRCLWSASGRLLTVGYTSYSLTWSIPCSAHALLEPPVSAKLSRCPLSFLQEKREGEERGTPGGRSGATTPPGATCAGSWSGVCMTLGLGNVDPVATPVMLSAGTELE